MQTYLMFARRLVTRGQPVDFNEQEKLRLALMIGGVDLADIMMYTGNQVVRGDDTGLYNGLYSHTGGFAYKRLGGALIQFKISVIQRGENNSKSD